MNYKIELNDIKEQLKQSKIINDKLAAEMVFAREKAIDLININNEIKTDKDKLLKIIMLLVNFLEKYQTE